jgi:hypothetical protein
MSACRRGVVVVYVRGLSWGKARLGVIRDALHRSSKAPLLSCRIVSQLPEGKTGNLMDHILASRPRQPNGSIVDSTVLGKGTIRS